jgi:hypothetical protein
MDKEFQTSFIPKKPLTEERIVTRRPVSLVNFVVTLIFIGSLVAAGGAYAYQLTLKKSVSDMDAQLVLARNSFDPSVIAEMQMLDKRLKASGEILDSHIMISPIFISLQSVTLKTVSYTKFTYELKTEAGKKQVDVQMSGKATGYDAIALQSDSLATNKYIKNPIFSNLNLDEKGRVTFDLSFTVDPSFVNYSDTVNREGIEQAEQMAEEQLTLPESMMAPEETTPTDATQQGIIEEQLQGNTTLD